MADMLTESRKIINDTDKEIAKLFEKRMHTVRNIAEYKIQNNIPVLDSGREQEIIEKNSLLLEDKDLIPYYVEFLKDVMKISRDFQNDIIGGNKE